MSNTKDLRYARTEAAIRAAFIRLVSDMPVGKVSASVVCRSAGISRNAFYLHHSGVSELYASLVGELIEDVRTECIASSRRVAETGAVDADFSPAVLGALCRHEDLLRALLPSDDGSLSLCLADGLASVYIEAALLFGEHGGSFEHRLGCSFSAWAHVGLLRCWIATDERPLLEMLPSFQQLQAGVSENSTRFLRGGSSGTRASS